MELDEMKQAWQALDRRLAQQHALNLELHRERVLDRMRHGLRPLRWGQWVQFAFGAVFLLIGVSFISSHLGVAHWVICGALVQLLGILMMAFAGRILSLLHGMDYGMPVLDIQRRLAELRRWRTKVEAPVFTTVGAFIWVPLLLMFFQLSFDPSGGDVWDAAPGLVWNLVLSGFVSLVIAWGAYALLRFFGKRDWLERNFVGRSLLQAEAMMDEVRRFEAP